MPGLYPKIKRVAASVVRPDPRRNLIHRVARQLRGEPPLPASSIRTVLVLCHGNLFRSPFAAALLASEADTLHVTSAGLRAADDHVSPDRAIAIAAGFGVDLKPHRTRRVDQAAVDEADLILVMEGAHVAELLALYPDAAARTRVLGDYLAEAPRDLPDPWREDDAVGRVIFERVVRAVSALARRIAEHESAVGAVAPPGERG